MLFSRVLPSSSSYPLYTIVLISRILPSDPRPLLSTSDPRPLLPTSDPSSSTIFVFVFDFVYPLLSTSDPCPLLSCVRAVDLSSNHPMLYYSQPLQDEYTMSDVRYVIEDRAMTLSLPLCLHSHCAVTATLPSLPLCRHSHFAVTATVPSQLHRHFALKKYGTVDVLYVRTVKSH